MTEEHEERRRDVENDMNEDASTLPPGNLEGTADAPAPRNRASNLTEADRRRGGQSSARQQVRDAHGQFAGRSAKGEDGKEGARRARRTKNRS
jgi:hypothetical protein